MPELADDGDGRVEAMARALQSISPEVERLGRSLIRLTVESNATAGPVAAAQGGSPPRRGYRRLEWIERSLDPLRGRIDDRRLDRLVAALAMVVGWEAVIVRRDICGLTSAQGEELSIWAARALLHAARADAATEPGQ
jgi:hypothetical protein